MLGEVGNEKRMEFVKSLKRIKSDLRRKVGIFRVERMLTVVILFYKGSRVKIFSCLLIVVVHFVIELLIRHQLYCHLNKLL
jgi:hypothetical protein